MITYRLMTIEDYDQAYALWLECGNGLNDKDDSKEGIAKYLKRNPSTSFVAVCEEKVIGVILCGHDGRRGIIQHACVSPLHRREGIGQKLVELALNALKEEGITKVWVDRGRKLEAPWNLTLPPQSLYPIRIQFIGFPPRWEAVLLYPYG